MSFKGSDAKNYTVYPNLVFWHDDLPVDAFMEDTLQECYERCTAMEKCVTWSHYTDTSKRDYCRLKFSMADIRYHEKFVSGFAGFVIFNKGLKIKHFSVQYQRENTTMCRSIHRGPTCVTTNVHKLNFCEVENKTIFGCVVMSVSVVIIRIKPTKLIHYIIIYVFIRISKYIPSTFKKT